MTSVEEPEPQSELTMRFATPLPRQFVAGRTVPIPVVVLFGRQLEALPDTRDIWIFASLVNEDFEALSQEDLLRGQRADNIHPLSEGDEVKGGSFGYASFTNLVISAQGRYRFRMTAVEMRR